MFSITFTSLDFKGKTNETLCCNDQYLKIDFVYTDENTTYCIGGLYEAENYDDIGNPSDKYRPE